MSIRPKRQTFLTQKDSKLIRQGKKPFSTIRRNAVEVMNYRAIRKISLVLIAICLLILLIGYAFALLYNRTGRFTVGVNDPDNTFFVSLCEKRDFKTMHSRLICENEVEMTNICGDTLPLNIDQIDGEHNGENYLAYTFYCKNVGTDDISMNYELTFNNVTNGLDECVRVRLYVDGKYTDYAKTRSDGYGDETHYCNKTFAGNYTVCYDRVDFVPVGEMVRFTVVAWVEGDDVDCTDNVINGRIKFDMHIEAKAAILPEQA